MGKKSDKKRRQQQQQQRGYSTTSAPANNKTIHHSKPFSRVTTTKDAAQMATPPTTTTKSIHISSQTHRDLLNLLGTLDDEERQQRQRQESSSKRKASDVTLDRLYKKLYNIHDTLDQLGVSFENIEKAVTALGYDVTLEGVLDWLCLHLEAQDLPPIFTEGSVREQEQLNAAGSTQKSSSTLTVLKPTPRPGSNDDELETTVADRPEAIVPSPLPSMQQQKQWEEKNETNDDKPGNDTKAWILQQYQYEEENEDQEDAETPSSKEDGGEEEASQLQHQSQTEPFAPIEQTRYVDPNQTKLDKMEERLRQQEADLADEAANYMRSKQEVKELQASTKQLRKQVQGLRKRVEKNKVTAAQEAEAQAPETETANEESDVFNLSVEESNEDYGGGLFEAPSSGDGETATGTSSTEATKEATPNETAEDGPPPKDPVIPKDSIPPAWTGKTPKEILDDWCKKEKVRRPQFFKLPRLNGARIRVDVKPNAITTETDNYMGSYTDAQQYLSTKVLYHLKPDLPLYRLFPPFYRDLWRSWTESLQLERDSQQQQQLDAVKAKVDHLLECISKEGQATPTKEILASTCTMSGDNSAGALAQSPIADCWEDDADTDVTTIPEFSRVDNSTDNDITKQENMKDNRGDAPMERSGEYMRTRFAERLKSPKYQSMLKARSALPIYSYREHILETIKNNSVLILCAETGAGKTTQCPQFILEEALLKGGGDNVNVICTQPRRVAATSVAERVSDEMAEPSVGDTVGYQIRMEAKRNASTRLLFCTTGVVLRRLQNDPMLTGISHIVVDEVHERQYQVDCLLVMLRQLLRNGRTDLKIILMSATLDAKLFCDFFNGAPVINVPGRTFPVADYHLEDLLDATNHIIEEGSRYALEEHLWRDTASVDVTTKGGEKRKEVHALNADGAYLAEVSDNYPGYKIATRRSMDRVNEEIINYDLIEDVLGLLLVNADSNEVLLPPENSTFADGSVLIFLPGLGEIRALKERLEGNREFGNKGRFDIVPMHSTLSPQDQRRAFEKSKEGCRKIILSTNIAETSVTIPSVVCVIDSGRVREVRVDKKTSTSKLVTDWCSKASAKQRAGRAGRVRSGVCLKLYSSITAAKRMKDASQPEIRRVPLEDVCLSILAGSFADNCMGFLGQTPEPPAQEAVRSALQILREVGAVKLVPKGPAGKAAEELTSLGRHLARLPVDVRLGKMLIFGALFNCIDPALTIAASLSCKSPFVTFVNDALQAKAKHKLFAHAESDFLTLCNVFESFDKALSKGISQAKHFCYENYLSFSALREISDTRKHFIDLLVGIGVLELEKLAPNDNGKGRSSRKSGSVPASSYNDNKQNIDIVHSIICAGLYPHVGHLVPTESGMGERQLWYRDERLHFHSSSVNAKLKTTNHYPTSWIAFHEKFGTGSRIYVSTTCFVHPFAILVFGGELVVKHTERRVIVDDWIELPLAAQTGVMFRELREQVDRLLQTFLDTASSNKRLRSDERAAAMVKGIIQLLTTEATT